MQVVVGVGVAQNHARCFEAIHSIATASAAAAAGGGGFEPVIADEPLVEKGEGMVGCCCCHRCGQRELTVAMGGKHTHQSSSAAAGAARSTSPSARFSCALACELRGNQAVELLVHARPW